MIILKNIHKYIKNIKKLIPLHPFPLYIPFSLSPWPRARGFIFVAIILAHLPRRTSKCARGLLLHRERGPYYYDSRDFSSVFLPLVFPPNPRSRTRYCGFRPLHCASEKSWMNSAHCRVQSARAALEYQRRRKRSWCNYMGNALKDLQWNCRWPRKN